MIRAGDAVIWRSPRGELKREMVQRRDHSLGLLELSGGRVFHPDGRGLEHKDGNIYPADGPEAVTLWWAGLPDAERADVKARYEGES